MRAAGAGGAPGPLVHPGTARLDPLRLLQAPASLGLSLLGQLNRLGDGVARRYAAHEAALPPKRRISASSGLLLTSAVAVAGLSVLGAVESGTGANQWATAPVADVSLAAATPPATRHQARSLPTVEERLVIVTGGMTGHPGWPEFVDSRQIELPAHAKVVLTITSFDDGTAPLPKNVQFYDKVSGTVGGSETFDGKRLSSVSNAEVAHTFTVPGIGLNLVVPAATASKSGAITPAVVTASFVTAKSGSFTWQCYAPCGTGKNGEGGPMETPGYMTGKVVIG